MRIKKTNLSLLERLVLLFQAAFFRLPYHAPMFLRNWLNASTPPTRYTLVKAL